MQHYSEGRRLYTLDWYFFQIRVFFFFWTRIYFSISALCSNFVYCCHKAKLNKFKLYYYTISIKFVNKIVTFNIHYIFLFNVLFCFTFSLTGFSAMTRSQFTWTTAEPSVNRSMTISQFWRRYFSVA